MVDRSGPMAAIGMMSPMTDISALMVFFSLTLKPNPHAYEVQKVYQPLTVVALGSRSGRSDP